VDVLGRRIKTLQYNYVPRSGYVTTWGGRNERGERVAAGIYFIALEQDGHHASAKVILLR
jgi:hypothetical protein